VITARAAKPVARPHRIAAGAARSKRRRARTSTVSSRSLRRATIAFAIAATLCLTAYIGEYASVARASQRRAELRSELYREQQINSNLRAEVEVLERPARIDAIARAMKMEQRNDADFVALAPLPPKPAAQQRPILAGFLPEGLQRLFSHDNGL
jgi:cell division protein FtsL